MTLELLERVQAHFGLVSIHIQSGPNQLLLAPILTHVNFLLNSFLPNVLNILDKALISGRSVFCQTTVGVLVIMDRKI